MREIIFRGKIIELCEYQGQWLEGFYAVENGKPFIAIPKENGLNGFYCDPETVGQYTGLKDKNNVDAFEGDIVVCNQSGSYGISVIIYDNSAFYVMPLNGNILERTLWDYWYNDWDIEVIGNIHDNPELLEVKEHE